MDKVDHCEATLVANHDLDPRVRKALLELKADMNVSLRQLALRVGLSESRLAVLLNQYLGEDLRGWKRNERLRRACSLLTHTHKPIKTIQHECGIRDPSNFVRLFRKYIGKSPSEFRRTSQKRHQRTGAGKKSALDNEGPR